MRIRKRRNPIDVLATTSTIHRGPSILPPLPPARPVERPLQPEPQPAAASVPTPIEVAVCEVNMSSWDVTPLVLAFFHLDGLPQQQHCRSYGDHQQASTQEARAFEDRHGHCRSGLLSSSISSIKPCGNDRRSRGKGKQEGKRWKALFVKSEGSLTNPTTICRDLQISKKGAPKKGEEGLAVGKVKWSGGVKRTCKREDGKGWRCGNEAKAGSSLCDHHLSQVRSYCKRPSNKDYSKRPSPPLAEGDGRRQRPTALSSSWSSSTGNDCYYYYYTGFGPAWRERKRVSAIAEENRTSDDDNDDDDDDDDDGVNGEAGEGGEKGKIKGRKRVKCRSLKSLL